MKSELNTTVLFIAYTATVIFTMWQTYIFTSNVLYKATVTLQEEIKSIPFRDNWSSRPEELDPEYVSVPPSLQKLLHVLLGGTEIGSALIIRIAWSMAQDNYCH